VPVFNFFGDLNLMKLNTEWCGRKGSYSVLWSCHGIRSEELNKTKKKLRKCNYRPSTDYSAF